MSTFQVRTLEESDQIIREHERKTKTLYALLRSTKNFGCADIPDCANEENEVRFETVGVPYCGAPFYVAGIKILQCQSFKRRGPKIKKDPKSEKSKVNKKKSATGRTHKLGCTATVIMKEVIYYPEFQMYDHSKMKRVAVARHLKDVLKAKAQVQKDRIIYITVPGPMDHFGHTLATNNTGLPMKGNVKRLYVKNDFYGHNDPCNSRRVYNPIKQEKVGHVQPNKKLKLEEVDSYEKTTDIREILQSIMAFTYKPGTSEAFGTLLKDLHEAREKYKQSIDSIFYSNPDSVAISVTGTQTVSTPQIISIQASSVKDGGWQRPAAGQATAAQIIPDTATVVAVANLPLNVTATCDSNAVTLQSATAHNSIESTSQETSIFLEAMEAIFNPQM